ncbi:MAG: hypothetical protein ACLFU0_00800 [Alphaproteobacteria bacterium]
MEQFDTAFGKLRRPAFDQVPAAHRHRLMGVDYARIAGKQGGELYVTRHGWACLDSVLPRAWFVDDRFKKVGRALAGATGAVYRVPVDHHAREDFALVVKFSRAAQDIRVTILDQSAHLDALEHERIEAAAFLSPFEEFANLVKLRMAAGSAVRTELPLAIYSPPTRYADWQLGRHSHLCSRMNRALAAAQADVPEQHRVTYDWERLYILLYRWIDGVDAEVAAQTGLITKETMVALGQEARARLRALGWMVCDHKPRHVIVRPSRRGHGPVRRGDRIPWALIDYELLVPV